jgi:hypothetical protein
MTTYTVHFRTDAESATHDIKAATPEQALALAHELDAPSELSFDPYNGIMPVNEILVYDADGKKVAAWRDDDLRLRLAAPELLDALETLVARDRAEARECGFDDDEMSWLEDADRAIAKAKGGAV